METKTDYLKVTLTTLEKTTLKSLAITRTINSLEMRLEESLNMRPSQLIDLDWNEIIDGLQRAVSNLLEQRYTNLLGESGQVSQNIETSLTKSNHDPVDLDRKFTDMLIAMSTGTRMMIDPRTHQKGMRNVRILNFIFLGAKLIQDLSDQKITDLILEHLEETQKHLEVVWGKIEFDRFRLAGIPLQQLDVKLKEGLIEELGETEFGQIEPKHPEDLPAEQQQTITTLLGARIQNDIYRHILVSVISELWVEYLTKVDALRVSVGLEAFAQRDPLVQYKSEAAGMFKQLLSDIRAGVISRMFLFQPRRASTAVDKSTPVRSAQAPTPADSSKKKRKRH
jgi:preprotein translocase subunit SecA